MSQDYRPPWVQERTDLTEKTALILGGTGGVGEGVVHTLLELGATVVATGRDPRRLDDFANRNKSTSLSVITLDGSSDDLPDRAVGIADQFGPFDAVIVSIASRGKHGGKPLLTLTDTEWSDLLDDNLTAVFRAYRAFVPSLRPDGLLLQLNGASADIAFPGNAVVALTAAAGKSMTRTLAVELHDTKLRVYEVILGVVRTRARQLAGIDNRHWIDGQEVGVHIAELMAKTSPLLDEVLQYFIDKTVGPTAAPPRI